MTKKIKNDLQARFLRKHVSKIRREKNFRAKLEKVCKSKFYKLFLKNSQQGFWENIFSNEYMKNVLETS